jgi:hypothetical protein
MSVVAFIFARGALSWHEINIQEKIHHMGAGRSASNGLARSKTIFAIRFFGVTTMGVGII